MKKKLTDIVPLSVTVIPDKLQEGILFISDTYKTAVHLCACGCGGSVVTPFNRNKGDGWKLLLQNEEVTMSPSIGNWSGENPYHAHYYIRANKIVWV
jgi:hypothetical protein